MTQIKKFLSDESGATAIEYGLIAVGIALAIVAAVGTVGDDLEGMFGRVSAGLAS